MYIKVFWIGYRVVSVGFEFEVLGVGAGWGGDGMRGYQEDFYFVDQGVEFCGVQVFVDVIENGDGDYNII